MKLLSPLKNIFYIVFIIYCCFSNALSQKRVIITPKINFDVIGTHDASIGTKSKSLSVKPAFVVGCEFLRPINSSGSIGIGMMYLFPRALEQEASGTFNFVTIYGSGIFKLSDSAKFTPSILMNLGYNLLFVGDSYYTGGASLKGGLYLGFGFRVSYNRLFVDCLFKSYSGSGDRGEEYYERIIDVSYTTLSVGIGIQL